MKRATIVTLAAGLGFAVVSGAWASAPPPERRAAKESERITAERVMRLATVGNGGKLKKIDKKRVAVGVHVMLAIRQKASAEKVTASASDINAQLKAWNVAPASADPNKARNYDEQEQAAALREVAETQVLFDKLAAKLGGPKQAYEAAIGGYVEAIPNSSKMNVGSILKAVPALLAGGSGQGGNVSGDAASLLGAALAPKPAPLAKTLERTVAEFDGNPDHLPLVYPNSAVASGR